MTIDVTADQLAAALDRLYGQVVMSQRPSTISPRQVLRATCTVAGCGWQTNPRGNTDDIWADLGRHAIAQHRGRLVKHIRDIQRAARLAAP